MSNNLATVQQIYSAFGKGEIPTILEALADDVLWEEGGKDHGIPWLRPGRGKGHAAKFFAVVAEAFDIKSFQAKRFFESGDQVLVHCHMQATVRSTGRPLDDGWELHLWTLGSSGKVVAFRHVVDTVQHLAACRP
jgi:hypothetical protein